jgi:DNA recombination protein RmuC
VSVRYRRQKAPASRIITVTTLVIIYTDFLVGNFPRVYSLISKNLRGESMESVVVAAILGLMTVAAVVYALKLRGENARLAEVAGQLDEAIRDRDGARSDLAATATELARVESKLEETVRHATAERERLETENRELDSGKEALVERNTQLIAELSELRTRNQEQRSNLEQQRQQLSRAEEKLGDTFKALSQQALRNNNEQFLTLAAQKQDATLKPVFEKLTGVKAALADLESKRTNAYAELRTQVDTLTKAHATLQAETHNLVGALKHGSTRGRWGELQLKRVVELAGMVEHCDFDTQHSVSTETGVLRPDLVVHLPGGRTIVIDAKAPMNAYIDAMEEDDEKRRTQALARYVEHFRNHIKQLSSKTYWREFDGSAELVVMFLPGESLLSVALHQDPRLIEFAAERHIILATPTTLIGLMRAVNHGWSQQKLAKNAQVISQLGGDLYDALAIMTAHMRKMGGSLKSAVDHYNSMVGSTERNVTPKARRLRECGVPAKKDIGELDVIDTATRQVNLQEFEELAETTSPSVVSIESGRPPALSGSSPSSPPTPAGGTSGAS